jgi:endo-1,4-beta-xylanase
MLSFATAVLSAVAVVGAAPQPHIEERQNSFNAIQNWANDYADVEFHNNAGGNFNVTWDNNPGGNFVVGKGYRPGRDM